MSGSNPLEPNVPRKRVSFDFQILPFERFWIDLHPFLLRRGYQLRPRYRPGWKPSWHQVEVKPGERRPSAVLFEDSATPVEFIINEPDFHKLINEQRHPDMLDAVRVSDGCKVVFKRVKTNTDEIPIARFLSSADKRKDPRNCCVPILDVIMVPGTDEEALLVMPQLINFASLPYRFLGEFSEFALQILSGVEFMHEHNVAHRDACWYNIMVDPTKLVPKGSHFCVWDSHDGVYCSKFEWNTRWSVQPIQYYFIDFGESSLCSSKEALVVGTIAQDKTAPELSTEVPFNPFMLDIYHIGNVFKECIEFYKGLGDYRELARLMTRPNPKERPSASECVKICKLVNDKIRKSGRMKSRVWRKTCELYVALSPIEKLAVVFGKWNPAS